MRMLKVSFLPIIGALVFISGNLLLNQDREESLFKENLEAAIELDRKYIRTCTDNPFDYSALRNKAPLFEGLGDHQFPISSADEEAQTYFNQGLNLVYGFNHSEAHRSFKQAAILSEESPMTYWGQAYAIGPNINDNLIDDDRKQIAHDNLVKAYEHLDNANALERALIEALRTRYRMEGDSIIVDHNAYMEAMSKVAKEYEDHPDILTLYVAAIMNTMPWDYWNKDMTPKANAQEAVDVVNKAISLDPQHAGALHYHIHLTELPMPDEAAKSGDALAPLMPGSGHIVHMPSHAYIRVGRYKDAAEANLKAIATDEDYISQCYAQGMYPLGYYPHNIHFLWSASTQLGDKATALAAARKTAEKVPLDLLDQMPFFQEFAAVPIQAYVRFGEWNEILTIPYPGDKFQHLKSNWHYGRGMAFVRKGELQEAEEEVMALSEMAVDSSLDEIILFSGNSVGHMARIAHHIVAGELLAARGEPEEADRHFKTAIALEDDLRYAEPPAWHQPCRLNYGNFLLEQEHYDDAVAIFSEELEVMRHDGWALRGLVKAHKGLGNTEQVSDAKKRFKEAWKYADTEISGPVM